MNTSVCKSFDCPFWSDGKSLSPGAPRGGYGCKRVHVATHCLVSQVAGVSATEYELFYDTSRASPNQKTLIKLGIEYLVAQENETHRKF